MGQVDQPQVSKIDRVRQLAREAGHQMGPNEQCIRCGMHVPMGRNIAFLDAVLHLRCMGSVGAHFPTYKLVPTDGSDSHYMFGRTRVHASHVMATHYHLKTHLCTFCGAYGAKRSYRLQAACPASPPKAGLDAIRLISLGRRPDIYKARHEERHGKQVFNPLAKKRPFKASWAKRPKTTQGKRARHDLGADLLGPPSFSPKGPKAAPCPEGIQPQDLIFLESHRPRHVQTSPDDNGPPAEFSPPGHDFSGPQARDSKGTDALACDPPPRGNWPRRVPRSHPSHAVCSQHGRDRSWSMANFCDECDRIAVAALADFPG